MVVPAEVAMSWQQQHRDDDVSDELLHFFD
jgi:hypothetical protein